MTTSYEASSVSASTCMKSAWTITLLYHHFPSCMMVCTEVKSEPPETSVDYKEGLQLGCTFSCEKLVGEFSCSPRKWEENKKRRTERRNEIKGHLIWAFEQSGEQVNEHKGRKKWARNRKGAGNKKGAGKRLLEVMNFWTLPYLQLFLMSASCPMRLRAGGLLWADAERWKHVDGKKSY